MSATFQPVKIVDVELSSALAPIEGLDGYQSVQALIRLHGAPLGYVRVAVDEGRYDGATLSKNILNQHGRGILRHLLSDRLATAPLSRTGLSDVLNARHPPHSSGSSPIVTVAVCTRDRAIDLAQCLDSLKRLDYPALDILVVDNAPTSDATQRVVASHPQVRYAREPRPGLDWARNCAIREARGEIIAYTDDDVVVDPGWVAALAAVFAENPEVMAVTGLVMPSELETEAQMFFELYGGFGRGFQRQWFRVDRENGERAATHHGGAGRFGTGANMAYRRKVFESIGSFDAALDVGTVTNGGGDLEMFFRVLKEGHTLVYEPGAIVRHRHRRTYAQLRTQLTNNGVGFYSYLVRSALAYPDERRAFIKLGLWWLWWWNIRRLLISFVHPERFPRDLILAELRGVFTGLSRYQKSRRTAAQIARSFENVSG